MITIRGLENGADPFVGVAMLYNRKLYCLAAWLYNPATGELMTHPALQEISI